MQVLARTHTHTQGGTCPKMRRTTTKNPKSRRGVDWQEMAENEQKERDSGGKLQRWSIKPCEVARRLSAFTSHWCPSSSLSSSAVSSRWTTPHTPSRAPTAHILPARGGSSREKTGSVDARVIQCVMRVRLDVCIWAVAGSVPVIYIITISASQQTCLHVNVRQFQVERPQNEIQCSALFQQSRCCAACWCVCVCGVSPACHTSLKHNSTFKLRAKISWGKRSYIDW